jgi:hypothetical protein
LEGEGAGFGRGEIFSGGGIIFLAETINVERFAFCE